MDLNSEIKASVWAAVKSEDYHDGDIDIVNEVDVNFDLESLKDLDILRNLIYASMQNNLSKELNQDQKRLYDQFTPRLKSLKISGGMHYFCDVQIKCEKAEQLLFCL